MVDWATNGTLFLPREKACRAQLAVLTREDRFFFHTKMEEKWIFISFNRHHLLMLSNFNRYESQVEQFAKVFS